MEDVSSEVVILCQTIDTDSASSTSESEEEVVVRGNHNPLLIRSYVPVRNSDVTSP
jgi:hypothetical protein